MPTCPLQQPNTRVGVEMEPTSHLGCFSLRASGRVRSCLWLRMCLIKMATTCSLFCTPCPHDCAWQQPCLLCCLHDEGSQLSRVLETSNLISKHRLTYGPLWASPWCKSHYFLPFSFQGRQDRRRQESQANSPSPESLQNSSSLLGAASFFISALLMGFSPSCISN